MSDTNLVGKQLYTTVFTQTVNTSADFPSVRNNTRFRNLANDAIYFKDNNGFITLVNQGAFPILNQNTTGNAATASSAASATVAQTVVTNANLTGDVTSIGNASTLAAYINGTAIVVPLGGGQTGATVLTNYDNVIDAVGTVGYGVILSSSTKNYRVKVRNNDAVKDLLVYPLLETNFIGFATNAAFTISAYGVFEFVCYENGEMRYE